MILSFGRSIEIFNGENQRLDLGMSSNAFVPGYLFSALFYPDPFVDELGYRLLPVPVEMPVLRHLERLKAGGKFFPEGGQRPNKFDISVFKKLLRRLPHLFLILNKIKVF